MIPLPRPPTSHAAPYLWMLGGAAAFSVMSVLTGITGEQCDWQIIAVVRSAVALVLALSFALAGGAKLVFLRPGKMWMRSIAGSISLVANFYAMTHLPVSDVLTVTNMFPLWVAILSWPLLGTRPPADTWIAAIIGVVGVVVVQQPHFADGGLALAACVLSSFTSAIALIGLHQLHGLDPRAVVAHFSGVSLVFCLVAAFVFKHEHGGAIPSAPHAWLLLATLATAATAGQIMLTKAFAAGPPARVSVVNLAQVGMAATLELLFRGRTFSGWTLFGMLLVLTPTAWVLIRRLPEHEPAEPSEETKVEAAVAAAEPEVLPTLPNVPEK